MSKRLTLPGKKENFSKYAGFVHGFWKTGIIAQVISGVTAFMTYYIIFENRMPLIYNHFVTGFIAFLIAFVLVSLIEGGQRVSFPAATEYFLTSNKDRIEKYLGWIVIGACVLFIGLSTYGSLKIVPVAVDESEGEVVEGNTFLIDSLNQSKIDKNQNLLIIEQSRIENLYSQKIESNQKLNLAKINSKNKEKKYWINRGYREKVKYTTRVSNIDVEISKIELERDTIETYLLSKKARKIESLYRKYEIKNNDLDSIHKRDVSKVEQKNELLISKSKRKKNSFNLLGFLVIIVCQIWAAASIVCRRLFFKLSEIEEIYIADQYYFEESQIEKFFNAISIFIKSNSNRFSDWIISKSRLLPEAKPLPELYNYKDYNQSIINVEIESKDRSLKIESKPSLNESKLESKRLSKRESKRTFRQKLIDKKRESKSESKQEESKLSKRESKQSLNGESKSAVMLKPKAKLLSKRLSKPEESKLSKSESKSLSKRGLNDQSKSESKRESKPRSIVLDITKLKKDIRNHYKGSIKTTSEESTRSINLEKYLDEKQTLNDLGFDVLELENGTLSIMKKND